MENSQEIITRIEEKLNNECKHDIDENFEVKFSENFLFLIGNGNQIALNLLDHDEINEMIDDNVE